MRYEFFRALSALRFKSALSAYEPTMLFIVYILYHLQTETPTQQASTA